MVSLDQRQSARTPDRTPAAPPGGVARLYREKVEAGELAPDPAQQAVAAKLDALANALATEPQAVSGGLLGWLRPKPASASKGLYLWGEVGRGKTMLMDMFFESAPVARKRRSHFNHFMADVHRRVARQRAAIAAGEAKDTDPVLPVADALAAEARLLCFDEFAVTDIADAMILGRLFTRLFEAGTVLVATSNVAPDRLYAGGLNRQNIVPFLRLLVANVEVVRLEGGVDHRLDRLAGSDVYFLTTAPGTDEALDRLARRLRGGRPATSGTVTVLGRDIPVRRMCGGFARFEFAELCEAPLGANDYIALAQRFHTVMIEHVPVLRGEPARNAASRFITLIDILYDNRTRLIVSAAAEPDQLIADIDGKEAFAFKRTASRLHEMRSAGYLAGIEDMPLT